MAEKDTTMVLNVDLHCPRCYKEIKKILAKIPQIRSQAYDEKKNTVTITVVCCDPQKFRDKLCCKGGKRIKSIEIKEPPKPKETDSKKTEENPDGKKPQHPPPIFYPVPVCCGTCYGCNRGGQCYQVRCGMCYGCCRGGICVGEW